MIRFIGSYLDISKIISYSLKITVTIEHVTSHTKSSNASVGHTAVPLEFRNSSKVNSKVEAYCRHGHSWHMAPLGPIMSRLLCFFLPLFLPIVKRKGCYFLLYRLVFTSHNLFHLSLHFFFLQGLSRKYTHFTHHSQNTTEHLVLIYTGTSVIAGQCSNLCLNLASRILSCPLDTGHVRKTQSHYGCMAQTTLKISHVIATSPVHWRTDCCLATSYTHSSYCCLSLCEAFTAPLPSYAC
jgi:hypothetical protein